jgi:beta-glucan synthesis-associated protein KRE6
MNLGISQNFGFVDLEHLTFPTTMRVDYIRVYQPTGSINIGCDPEDFPTEAYINQYVLEWRFEGLCLMRLFTFRYIEAYTNPNLTTWRTDYGQPFPKSSFLGQC